MVLPPALLARLQKRGIIKPEEEVIAENYETESPSKKYEEHNSGAPGCPNRYNPAHLCVEFCYDHWGDGIPEYRLPERYVAQKNRMLAKFPLPENWIEVYDAGVGKYYFWNKSTDEVCWLSPRHPRAIISDAAPSIAKENAMAMFGHLPIMAEFREQEERGRSREETQRYRGGGGGRDDFERRRDGGRREEKDRKRKRNEVEEDDPMDLAELNDRDRLRHAKKKGIDPMDPAAYGDAPVGKWSDGLKADTVTGADVTAGGPLFQQRPYPAPGAILRKQQPPSS